jgi:hypothetical protein
MGSRHPAIAASITDAFPDPDIVYLYLYPLTSSDEVIRSFNSGYYMPDVAGITRICELYFPWASRHTILAKFEATIFPAVLVAVVKEEVLRQEAIYGRSDTRSLEVNIHCSR